jgi:hypothetical protein
MRVDAFALHFIALERSRLIVSYLADIPCAQAPALAGCDRACCLSSSAAFGGEDFDFRVECREAR